jgi:Putative auto-transporter adhesin, head GIN domain
MKNLIVIFVLLFSHHIIYGQERPLKGKGEIVKKEFDIKDFDKIKFQDLDGKLEVMVGKEFKLELQVAENLEKYISFKLQNGTLEVVFENNKNNKRYVEDSHIKVRISLPKLIDIEHIGNTNLMVSNIDTDNFSLENDGNGSATLFGKANAIKINKAGNGNVNAENVFVKKANLKSFGNGNVKITASEYATAIGAGNGNVYIYGTAKISNDSGISGNGEVKAVKK